MNDHGSQPGTQIKRLWFPFFTLDYPAAEGWLNEQAQAGYRLSKIDPLLRRTTWTPDDHPPQYAIALWRTDADSIMAPWIHMEFDEFQAFCAEAGWEYVADIGYFRIFAADAKQEHAPFSTDPAADHDMLRTRYFRHMALCLSAALLGGLLWLMLFFGGFGPVNTILLAQYMGVASMLLIPPALLIIAWYLCRLLWIFMKTKRGVKTGARLSPMPVPRAWRLAAVLRTLSLAAPVGFLLAVVLDLVFQASVQTLFGMQIGLGLLLGALGGPASYRQPKWLRYGMPVLVLGVTRYLFFLPSGRNRRGLIANTARL